MSHLSNSPCPGSFTLTQKRLFSGFPLAVMTPQACEFCGARTLPDRNKSGDWVPQPHLMPAITAQVLQKLA
jgi:hypothetical protein